MPDLPPELEELPPELEERPGIVWLYVCMQAGLSIEQLKSMRIDQAEALIELKEFMGEAIADMQEEERQAKAEENFWNL